MRAGTIAAAIVLSLTGCTATGSESEDGVGTPSVAGSSATPSPSAATGPSSASAPPTATASPTTPQPTRSPSRPPVRFDADEAMQDVRHLAQDIGPREATSRNFAQAADFVEKRFEDLGYRVRRTSVSVPAGNSWGTPVRKGRSVNVIAEPRGFDSRRRHVVVGAHLDTIPVSPGAEDNASGHRCAAGACPAGQSAEDRHFRSSSSHSAPRSLAAPATPGTTSGPSSTSPTCPGPSAERSAPWCPWIGSE